LPKSEYFKAKSLILENIKIILISKLLDKGILGVLCPINNVK
jgi:hypothetical protein